MNNKHFSLAQAFLEAEKRDYEAIDTTQMWVPSYKFNQSMNSLIKKEKTRVWKYINTTGKKVAVIILVCILFSSFAMSVEAIRTPVVRFVTVIYETFTKIIIDNSPKNSPPAIINQKLCPSLMIEGYEQTSEHNDVLIYQLRWVNKNNDEIVYQQNTLANYSAIIDTEKSPHEYINIDQGEAIYFKSNDKHSVIWNNESYAFKITCPLSISIDDLIRLANSVK